MKPNLQWGVERRLEFIEFWLYWEGRVNRADIVDAFGVSVTQASADMNHYIAHAPRNTAYSFRSRTFGLPPTFRPIFLKPDTNRYLALLRSIGDDVLDRGDAWLSTLPAYDAAPTPARGVNAEILRTIASCIARAEAIEIRHQSLSRPAPLWRWISPYVFGFDGFRWHARAFCHLDMKLKDFLLSPILDTRLVRPANIDPSNDKDWSPQITLEIDPHPQLSDTQKRIIELDYEMKGGRSKISIRRAFLYYILKRLGLDTDPTARRPQNQQIVLLNSNEVMASQKC